MKRNWNCIKCEAPFSHCFTCNSNEGCLFTMKIHSMWRLLAGITYLIPSLCYMERDPQSVFSIQYSEKGLSAQGQLYPLSHLTWKMQANENQLNLVLVYLPIWVQGFIEPQRYLDLFGSVTISSLNDLTGLILW